MAQPHCRTLAAATALSVTWRCIQRPEEEPLRPMLLRVLRAAALSNESDLHERGAANAARTTLGVQGSSGTER